MAQDGEDILVDDDERELINALTAAVVGAAAYRNWRLQGDAARPAAMAALRHVARNAARAERAATALAGAGAETIATPSHPRE
jgi:hypothetical protein